MKKAVLFILLAAFASPFGTCAKPETQPHEPPPPAYWPTKEWRVSTPERQGMDSRKLLEMIDYYEAEREAALEDGRKIFLDSVTIVRNGQIVADLYFDPLFPRNTKHVIHSCTKSIISALVGIAVHRGDIKSIDTPVLDFFPDKKIANLDARKRAMTVKDLLTMRSGLDSRDSFLFQWDGLYKMLDSRDWVEHALSRPMAVEPGERFDYSNMSSFLLSAILTRATGVDTLTYAKTHLFGPLGIQDVRWERSPGGVYIGWARMWLKPRDMAKIGLLYLQKGRWDDRQILPARWIEESTRVQGRPGKYRVFKNEDGSTNHELSTGFWLYVNLARPFSEGYGYQWWLDENGMYTALGHQGQFIMVAPRENLVVVFTGKLTGRSTFLPAQMLKDYILPAVVSNESMAPASEADQKELARRSEPPPPRSQPSPVPELPGTAAKVSGKTYSLESNPWKYDDIRLDFEPGAGHAVFAYTAKGREHEMQVGLDGVYRLTRVGEDRFAAKGRWAGDETFVIDYQIVGYSIEARWTFRFERDLIEVQEFGVTGEHRYNGRVKN